MLVLICVMIFAFIVTVAFSVDIAYMHLVKAELRSSTDAAAKAAAQTLANTQDVDQAIASGKAIAELNEVAGQPLQLKSEDFVFGSSQPDATGRYQFVANKTPINSIQVRGSRDSSSLSGPVGLIFGRMLGRDNFQPTEEAIATFMERDVVLVIDRSGSMSDPSETKGRSKFDELKVAVSSFVNVLKANSTDESVGLASYSSTATQDVQLTKTLDSITTKLNSLRASGNTSISAGMDAGRIIMNKGRNGRFVERTMIVMTDGLHNTGRSPLLSAQEIAGDGVIIHTITFGRDADQTGMKKIASIGSGRHFHAKNGTQLDDVFKEIAKTLSTMVTK